MNELTLHQAAEELGVHYMTAYRYVRLGLLHADKVGGTWRVGREDLEDFRRPVEGDVRPSKAPWASRLEGRMIAGDLTGAWGVVEAALAAGATPASVYRDILTPALWSIGERWAGGDIGVEEEHVASAVAAKLVGRLGPRFNRRGRPRGSVVTAMPAGDRHGLGLAMLADILRGAGYAVLDLGPDTPTGSLLQATARLPRLSAVCLSVCNDEALPAAEEMVSGLRQSLPDGVPVIIGGGAVDAAWAERVGADAYTDDATAVAGLIEARAG